MEVSMADHRCSCHGCMGGTQGTYLLISYGRMAMEGQALCIAIWNCHSGDVKGQAPLGRPFYGMVINW